MDALLPAAIVPTFAIEDFRRTSLGAGIH